MRLYHRAGRLREPATTGAVTLSFTGTLASNTAATGTMKYTPPRTLTQTFTEQTVTGVSITR